MPLLGRALMMASRPDPEPMVLVYDTTIAAGSSGQTSVDKQISLPLRDTVACNVNWGDGSDDDYTTDGIKTHTYASNGEYTVTISGLLTGFGFGSASFPTNAIKLKECQSFGTIGLTSLFGAFNGATVSVLPDRLPNGITNMSSMFFVGTGPSEFPSSNPDVSNWDVSSVTNMFNMFFQRTSFQGIGLDEWDISGISVLSGLNGFCGSAGLTTTNYDALLIAWEANKENCLSTLSPSFGSSKYSAGAAAAARASLISYGWIITDGGPA